MARLTVRQQMHFERLAPCALYVVASEGPIAASLYRRGGEEVTATVGHNRPVWPVRTAISAAYADTVSRRYDQSPLPIPVRARFRVWAQSEVHAGQLQRAVDYYLHELAEGAGGASLRHDYVDVGPDFDLDLFALEVMDIAVRRDMWCVDDEGLLEFLGRMDEKAVMRFGG